MVRLLFAIAIVLLVTICERPVFAAGVDQELADLHRRIEALEIQNDELRKAIAGQPASTEGPELGANQAESGTVDSSIEHRLDELESQIARQSEACPPEWVPGDADRSMTATWNHGLELKTADDSFRVHVGGRTQLDAGWFNVDEEVQQNINNPYEDGVDFRRGRLRIDGTMYSTIDWAVEYDFFNSFDVDGTTHTVTGPTDLWWTFKEVPCFGNIRVGNQKPAIGFEHLVSSRFLPFMERSFNQDSFYGGSFNGFLPGIACFDTWGEHEMGTWNVGLFKPTNNVFAVNATDGDYATVARLTRLLWYEGEGASLLHVGASVMQHTTVDGQITFRTRDAIRTGLSVDWPVPATTGAVAGDDMQWLNGELVAVQGPWTFQAEYLTSYLHDAAPIVGGDVQPGVGTVMYHGGYVQVLVFLTGEHDSYNKQTGTFERVIPRQNATCGRHAHGCGGIGAWQLGARYNYLDLNDDGLDGGVLNNFTAGLNWFLNPNMKVQFNYMTTDRDASLAGGTGDGWIHGWGVRVAHDF